MDASLSGLAVQIGRILRSHNTHADPRVDATACRALSVVSLVCVPRSRSHEVCGVVAINASGTHAFSDADVAVLTRLADFVSVGVGSAWDLHRASNQLLDLGHQQDAPKAPTGASDPTDEATGRYLMNVLNPDTVARIDARHRIQQVLDENVVTIVFQPVVDLFSGDIVAVEYPRQTFRGRCSHRRGSPGGGPTT